MYVKKKLALASSEPSPNSRSAGNAPTFTVSEQKTNQTDLLTYTTTVAHDASGAVSIQFTHAMAAVWFSIKSGSMQGTIGNITIPNVYNSGTYTIGGTGTGWSSSDSPTDYDEVAYSSHNEATKSLLLIPQDLSGKTVTIEFTPTGGSLTELTATLPTLNLQPGYRYELQLEISTDVKITNTISPWDTTTPDINESVALSYPPAGALPGKFTINSYGDQIYFSKGNLQYQASTDTWRFAENQWDYVGDDNTTGGNVSGSDNRSISSTYSGWIDLFGWGTAGHSFATGYGSAYQPWSSTQTSTAYGPTDGTSSLTITYSQGDWGTNAINNGGNTANSGWRTLTSDEWYYLFMTRTDAANKYGWGTVCGVKGLIILPDNFTDPMTNGGSSAFVGSTTITWTANVYSSGVNWSAKESAGAVFLPLTGYRRGATLFDVATVGYYWSSSASSTTAAYYIGINATYLSTQGNYCYRYDGYSVRLVRPVE